MVWPILSLAFFSVWAATSLWVIFTLKERIEELKYELHMIRINHKEHSPEDVLSVIEYETGLG